MSSRKRPGTTTCAHCGATFRAGRLACPECGSDADTGWQSPEEIDYASVEIPDFYSEPEPARSGVPGLSPPAVRVLLVVLALAMLVAAVVLFR